jgi:two-component system NtrC family sensor kinase
LRLSDIVEDVLALNNRALVERQLEVETEWNASLRIQGFPAQLRQVFSNLVRNAIEASFTGGKLRIRTSDSTMIRDRRTEPAVRVTIADRGHGIPPENMSRIFDAFFTTKDLKGSGVGLWLSATIIHEHRGRIRVRSSTLPGCSGTCLSIKIPSRWRG